MTTRADKFTQLQKLPDLFSDFLDDLTAHPISGDVARAKNEQSVKQAIRNLILTNYGERVFQPDIGCDVDHALFEFNDYITKDNLQIHIKTTLANHEPRINLLTVDVYQNEDDDTVAINIVFALINSQTPQNVTLFLRRVR